MENVVQPYSPTRTRLLMGLTVVTALGMLVTLYLALVYAGTDITQGAVQKIFYMHIGAFSGGSVAFFVTVLAGIGTLITRNPKWDRLALSSVEIGLPLVTITLVTGSIWARPIWNTWWTNDPRLNSMAVMWLIYAAYLTLRNAIENPDQRARFAAVYGILAFVSVIYVTSINRTHTDTLHPCVINVANTCPNNPTAEGGSSLTPQMVVALSVASVEWILVAATLIWYRVRMENVASRVQALKLRLMSR
ncbi:MAG TPA: cytochrome c biogenesis protein CcsA [Aggregatilineales bacterium]|nr:cytochrome c biogenesis protein CcsA [Aggregatilineales bacterium]